MTNGHIHIVIAEPCDVVRRGIRSIVEEWQGGNPVTMTEAVDAETLRSAMTAAQPDILIVNPGITFVLPPDRPDSRSVMLQSSLAESEHTSLYDEVISIYDTAPVIREKLANLIAGSRPVRRHEPLSSREKEIVVCLVKGMTNRRIAEYLHLSHHTVGTHRRNISAKLDIHSTSGLTVYAISNKLVRLGELETRR